MKDTHKWTKSKTALIVFDCILCLAVIVSAMLIVIDKSRIKNGVIYDGDDVRTTAASGEKPTEAPKGGASEARLMFAGDNVVHRGVFQQASNRADGEGYDFHEAYGELRNIIDLADLAYINQETVIDPQSEVSSYPYFNTPPEMLDELIDIGFDVFNQANNHVFDMELEGAENDLKFFGTKENIMLTGLYESEDEMLKAHTKEVNGITFSFTGLTQSLNGQEIPEDSDIGLLCLADERYSSEELDGKLQQMIKNAKEASDVVCVSVHWVDGDDAEPSETQQAIADKLLKYGADIIIGTGRQVLQPMEFKKNGDGEQALIIWSLGNLISCHDTEDYLLGGIADVTVKKDSAGKITIETPKLIPTITHYGEEISDVRVIPFSSYTEALANGHGIETEDFYGYIEEFYSDRFGDMLETEYK